MNNKYQLFVGGNLDTRTVRAIKSIFSFLMVSFLIVSTLNLSGVSSLFNTTKAQGEVSIVSLTLNSTEPLQGGGTLSYLLTLSEAISDVSGVTIHYWVNDQGEMKDRVLYFDATAIGNTIDLVTNLPTFNGNGDWSVNTITINSLNESFTFIFQAEPVNPSDFGFLTGNFTISDSIADTQAPQLISIGFSHDYVGPDTMVTITASAIDDVSGLSFADFELVYPNGDKIFLRLSPSAGSLQTNFHVSKFELEGDFKVGRIVIYDFAGNYAEYGNQLYYPEHTQPFDFSGVGFTVEGTSPIPQDVVVEEVQIEEGDYLANHNYPIIVRISPVDQNYLYATAYFQTPDLKERPISLVYQGDGVFYGEISVKSYDLPGVYQLKYLYFDVDQYPKISYNSAMYPNQSTTFDVLIDSFNIVGTQVDVNPPVIEIITVQKANMYAGQVNVLTVLTSDDHSMTRSVMVRFLDSNGQSHEFNLWQKVDNEFETHIYIDPTFAMTDWKLAYVELSDYAGNRVAYVSSEIENPDLLPVLDLSSGDFTVLGEAPRPEISSINNYQPIIGFDNYLHVELSFFNLDDANVQIELRYQSEHQSFLVYGQYIGDSTYSFSFYDLPWYPNGSYQLQIVQIHTSSGTFEIVNSNIYENHPYSYDLSSAGVHLLAGIEVVDLPIIDTFTTTPQGEPGETIYFELVFSEVFSNIDQLHVYFQNQYGRQFSIELRKTNTMTYTGSYYVHDYSYQGVYNISYLAIYYSNAYPQYLSAEDYLPPISFEISGTLTDSEPPVFISVESITKRVTKNETGIIHLRTTDSQSGVETVHADIVCNEVAFGISFSHVEGDLFVGTIDIRSYTPEGLCKVYLLSIVDVAGNVTQVLNQEYSDSGIDLSSSNFEVFDTTSTSYVLNYVNAVQSTRSIVGSGDLNITINFDEPFLETHNIQAVFVNERGIEKVITLSKTDNGVYSAFEYFDIYATSGLFKLDRIVAHTDWMEISIYHDDHPTGYPYFDFSDVYFEVVGTIEDFNPPQMLSSVINRSSATINQKVEFVISAIDLETEIEHGYIEVVNKANGFSFTLTLFPLMLDHFNAYFYVNSYMPEGSYRVNQIVLYDSASNLVQYSNERSYDWADFSMNLDHLDFAVSGTLRDYQKPTLKSLVFLDKNPNPNESFGILLEATDEGAGLSHATLTMKNLTTGQEFEIYTRLNVQGLNTTYGHVYDDVALGDYVVKSMLLQDLVGNSSQYCNSQVSYACNDSEAIPFNFENNQLTVSARSEPQYLEIFDTVYVSRNNLNAGDSVTIRVTLKEEYWWASMLFVHYDWIGGFAYLSPEFVSKGAGVFEAILTIDEYRRWNSEYKAQGVQLLSGLRYFSVYDDDLYGYYTDLEYFADFSQFNMYISQSVVDETSPILNGITFSKDQYRHNEYMRLDIDAIDLESRIEGVLINFRLDGKVKGTYFFINGMFLPFEDGKLVYSEYFMHAGMKPGLYEIDYIQIQNSFGLKTNVYNEKFYGQRSDSRSFESSKFEVISEDFDYVKPEFISAQINKRQFVSGDRITITVEAVDLGSGIRTGYLSIRNRQASFKDDHLLEQEYSVELRKISDRLLVAEFDVGPYFASGTFDISEIRIYDESFNGTTIKNSYFGIVSGSYDFSDMSFEVMGTQLDQDLPELVSLEVLTPVVALGDTISVKVNAFDLKSGVEYIEVVWQCGVSSQIVARGKAPKNPDEPIVLSGFVSTSMKACDYKVQFVYLSDHAGNWRYYVSGAVDLPQSGIMNFSQANIQVFGQTEAVVVNDVIVSNEQPQPLDLIEVSVDILDNIVKPETAYVNFRSNINTTRTVDLNLGGTMDYRGLIEIGEFEPSAVWEVDSITFIDRYGEEFVVYNSVYYPDELNVVDMSSAMFTVDNPLGDSQAPEYTGSQLEKGEETTASVYSSRLMSFASTQNLSSTTNNNLVFGPNDLISYTIDATDDISGVDRMEITYDILGKFITFNVALTELNGKYVGNARVMSYHPEGLWLVHKFVLIDKAGNRYEKSRTSSELGNLLGFAHLQLQVANTTEDKDAPVISDVSVNLSLAQVGDVVQFIGSASDANGIKDFNIVIQARTFGVERVIAMNPLEDGRYLGSFEITENTLGDIWDVKEIIVEDYAGNKGVITQQTQDLSSLAFIVKALTEISIEKVPDQLVYDLNDPFSLQGLILVAKYNDGTSETIDPSQLLVHGFDSSTENLNLDVYLQYKNKLTKLTVKVMDVAMVSMEITASPSKLTYTQGESLDLNGLIVWGYYNSGETELINITLDHVINPEVTSSAPGNYQVFIQYEGFEVFYYIEVVAPVEENKTPVTIVKTDTMMVITTPVGKVKVILFGNNGSKNLDTE